MPWCGCFPCGSSSTNGRVGYASGGMLVERQPSSALGHRPSSSTNASATRSYSSPFGPGARRPKISVPSSHSCKRTRRLMPLDQLARKLCHGFRRVPDHAPVTDLAVSPCLGDRHRDAVLVDVQANVGVELRHRSVLLCWAHELHQLLRRWSQLDVRADRSSAEHGSWHQSLRRLRGRRQVGGHRLHLDREFQAERRRPAGLVDRRPPPNSRPQDHSDRRAAPLALRCGRSITAATGVAPDGASRRLSEKAP